MGTQSITDRAGKFLVPFLSQYIHVNKKNYMKKSTTFGYPFISLLGHGCSKTFLLGLVHTVSYIIDELPFYKTIKKGYILLCGVKYVAWYMQFTI